MIDYRWLEAPGFFYSSWQTKIFGKCLFFFELFYCPRGLSRTSPFYLLAAAFTDFVLFVLFWVYFGQLICLLLLLSILIQWYSTFLRFFERNGHKRGGEGQWVGFRMQILLSEARKRSSQSTFWLSFWLLWKFQKEKKYKKGAISKITFSVYRWAHWC